MIERQNHAEPDEESQDASGSRDHHRTPPRSFQAHPCSDFAAAMDNSVGRVRETSLLVCTEKPVVFHRLSADQREVSHMLSITHFFCLACSFFGRLLGGRSLLCFGLPRNCRKCFLSVRNTVSPPFCLCPLGTSVFAVGRL